MTTSSSPATTSPLCAGHTLTTSELFLQGQGPATMRSYASGLTTSLASAALMLRILPGATTRSAARTG